MRICLLHKLSPKNIRMDFKKNVVLFTRKFQLAGLFDTFRFYVYFLKNYFINKKFKRKVFPFRFPPPYFIYETYSLNYKNYFTDGYQTAKEIVMLLSDYIDFSKPSVYLLDWGCGPARIVRHLPAILPSENKIYGCDYNGKYINWCKKNINGVNFTLNNLYPPTSFTFNHFDIIYGLSILTHLSAVNHVAWIHELHRILKPGGILLITSQGNAFYEKLLPHEKNLFAKGSLVIRESKNEGHRIFSAFQPKSFMEELLNNFTLLTFIGGGNRDSIHGLQDTWLVQKGLI